MCSEPLDGSTGATDDMDVALALIRKRAQAEAQHHTTHASPVWRIQQAMGAVAAVVSGRGGAQRVSDEELRRYVEAYLDAYDAETQRLAEVAEPNTNAEV